MRTPAELLTAARDQISDEDNWCQGVYARDEHGNTAALKGPRACQWCTVGALGRVSTDSERYRMDTYDDAMSELAETVGCHPARFNDHHTHREVIEAFNVTIARLQS